MTKLNGIVRAYGQRITATVGRYSVSARFAGRGKLTVKPGGDGVGVEVFTTGPVVFELQTDTNPPTGNTLPPADPQPANPLCIRMYRTVLTDERGKGEVATVVYLTPERHAVAMSKPAVAPFEPYTHHAKPNSKYVELYDEAGTLCRAKRTRRDALTSA